MSKLSESDYRSCILEPKLEKLGYPHRDLNHCRRGASFKDYGGTYHLDYLFYFNDEPILDIEAKPKEKQFDKAHEQATYYARNFDPVRVIPYIICAAGERIEMFKAVPSKNGVGVEFKRLEKLLSWKELISRIKSAIKPKTVETITETTLGLESLKTVYNELFKTLKQKRPKFKNDDEVVLAMNDILCEFITGNRWQSIRKRYNLSEMKTARIKEILGWYSLREISGHNLAYAYREFVTRQFTGTTPSWVKGEEREVGRYLTPAPVIDFMVKLCNPKPTDKIIDFACGSGGFLGAIVHRMLGKVNLYKYLKENIFACDVDEFSVSTARTFLTLLLRKDTPSISFNLFHHNGLFSQKVHTWEQDLGKIIKEGSFDLIISNPPGGARYNLGYEDEIKGMFPLERGKKVLQNGPLFIQRAIQLARNRGKICLIVPHGILANVQLQYLRKYIFENCEVKAIISLPRGIFPNVQSKMSILYMVKTRRPSLKKEAFLAGVNTGKDPETGEECNLDSELKKILERYKEGFERNKV